MTDTLNTINYKNFNKALEMSLKNYDYDELISALKQDEIIKKQIAVLNFTEIRTKEDAFLLSSCLTGQDGKIREVTAFKLNELALNPDYTEFFLQERIFKIFMDGLTDINGNICRMVVKLTAIEEFNNYLSENLPQRIDEIISQIKEMDLSSRQYITSKKNFQLYWNLEALSYCAKNADFEKIKAALDYCSEFFDYTIREKTAKILKNLPFDKIKSLINKMKNDDNYYVRKIINENI